MKVKKEFKPNLLGKNKYVYELPKKPKGFYENLIDNFRKRSFNIKYWANLFLDIPDWTRVYESRIQSRISCLMLNKLVDFHLKIMHSITETSPYSFGNFRKLSYITVLCPFNINSL